MSAKKVVVTITEDEENPKCVTVKLDFEPNLQVVSEAYALNGAACAVLDLIAKRFNNKGVWEND